MNYFVQQYTEAKTKRHNCYPLKAKCEPQYDLGKADEEIRRIENQEVNDAAVENDSDDVIFLSMRTAPVRVSERFRRIRRFLPSHSE